MNCKLCNTTNKIKYVNKLPNGSTVNSYYCQLCWRIINDL